MTVYSVKKYQMLYYTNVELHLLISVYGNVKYYRLVVNGEASNDYRYLFASLQNTKLGIINRFINTKIINYRIKKLGGIVK